MTRRLLAILLACALFVPHGVCGAPGQTSAAPMYITDVGKTQAAFTAGQDAQFDIVTLTTTLDFEIGYLKTDAFVDLSGSDILTGQVAQMHGIVGEAAWYNGKLFGLPIETGTTGVYYSELLAGYGVAPDELNTWEALLDFIDGLETGHTVTLNAAELDGILLYQYLHHYCDLANGSFDFTGPAFDEMLATIQRIYATRKIYAPGVGLAASPPTGRLFRRNDVLSLATVPHTRTPGWDNYFLPALNGDVNANEPEFYVTFAIVNPYGDNPDAALQHLEFLATHNHFTQSAALYPQADAPNTNAMYEAGIIRYADKAYTTLYNTLHTCLDERLTADEAAEKMREAALALAVESSSK